MQPGMRNCLPGGPICLPGTAFCLPGPQNCLPVHKISHFLRGAIQSSQLERAKKWL
jgi:hypothetical protein